MRKSVAKSSERPFQWRMWGFKRGSLSVWESRLSVDITEKLKPLAGRVDICWMTFDFFLTSFSCSNLMQQWSELFGLTGSECLESLYVVPCWSHKKVFPCVHDMHSAAPECIPPPESCLSVCGLAQTAESLWLGSGEIMIPVKCHVWSHCWPFLFSTKSTKFSSSGGRILPAAAVFIADVLVHFWNIGNQDSGTKLLTLQGSWVEFRFQDQILAVHIENHTFP